MALVAGSPLVLQAGAHKAAKFREMVRALIGTQGGVDAPGSCLVKQRASPGQGCLVAAGGLFLVGTTTAPAQGGYYDYNDADVDVPAPAADATNSRIDLLVYRVYDPDYVGGTDLVGDFEWIQGTASGSPVAPSLPADSLKLAQVLRAATNNTIVTANITDTRTYAGTWSPPHMPYYNVLDYGAKGDGATDDSVAINKAITAASAVGGGIVYFPPMPPHSSASSRYKIASTINMLPYVSLQGCSVNRTDSSYATGVVIDAGANSISVVTLPTGAGVQDMQFRDLEFEGGINGIETLDSATNVVVERCAFRSQSGAGVYVEGLISGWVVRDCGAINGAYGWRHVNSHMAGTGSGVTQAEMAKCSFYNVVVANPTTNGWNIQLAASSGCAWYSCTVTSAGQHGLVANGALNGWMFVSPYWFGNGTSGSGQFPTTGSISSGSNALAVASGVGIANGDPITVQGAGSGVDLQTTVSSGGGTTSLVLAANASTTVVAAEVTNRSYDDFSFNNSLGAVDGTMWMGGYIGGGSNCRYSVMGTQMNDALVTGTATDRPVYAPSGLTALGHYVWARVGTTVANSPSSVLLTTYASAPWATFISPPGKNIEINQLDSASNGTGTYGVVEVIRRNGNIPFQVDASGNVIQNMISQSLQANGSMKVQGALYPATPAKVLQTNAAVWAGSGAPSNSNGSNGDIYLRSDGGSGTTVYQRRSGAWATIAYEVPNSVVGNLAKVADVAAVGATGNFSDAGHVHQIGGTPYVSYDQSLTPSAVAGATVAEQTFTVTGLVTTDAVIVDPPGLTAGVGIAGYRVSATNTLAIAFVNPTAGSLTPISGTYKIRALRTL